ncbi:hypothetical protein ABIA33_004208 [Streptacidiphilus sp. MAP12-16]|uniref:transcriptional regulator n=1 Tax=Streptacidiphilus sp. MAP12-16 TaxID=3156300 RepID=UPI003518A8E1
MTESAAGLLESVRRQLALREGDNRLIPRIAEGSASPAVLAELAAQQWRIIASDRRSFLVLAARCADNPGGEYFAGLAAGESLALDKLGGFATACGLDSAALLAREPLAGCQAYPAYMAWLALNGDPAGVVLALAANFATWSGYCATAAHALRHYYDFDDRACAFFDFFAAPAPEAEAQALAVVERALPEGSASAELLGYGRLLQSYELMFWNTLADLDPPES